MAQVVEIAAGRDGWLQHAGVRRLLGAGDWFAKPERIATDGNIAELRDRIHCHISLLVHYPERCLFGLQTAADGNEGLLQMLRRLQADRADPAWPMVVALAVMHVSHPDGILHHIVPELSSIFPRPIAQEQALIDAIDALDGDQIEGLAGTLIGTLHFALHDAWDTPDHVRQPELQRIGPQPLPTPFSLPAAGDRHLTDHDGMELIGFTDPEDFPQDMRVVDCSAIVSTIRDTSGSDEWQVLAGEFRDWRDPAPALDEPLHRRICMMAIHGNGTTDLQQVEATARHVEADRTLVQFRISARPDERWLLIDVEMMATTAPTEVGERVAAAVLMSYWLEVVEELDQMAAPGDVVTIHLTPRRMPFDDLVMRIEADLVDSIADRDTLWGPVHGFLIDVVRSEPGDEDPLPLLGQHVAPPSMAQAWKQLEEDLFEVMNDRFNSSGVVTLHYQEGHIAASHGYQEDEFDRAAMETSTSRSLERLEGIDTCGLLNDFRRRHGWRGDLVLACIGHVGVFIMPMAAWWEQDWTREHQVVAHYREHPSGIDERNRARRFWTAFHPQLASILQDG